MQQHFTLYNRARSHIAMHANNIATHEHKRTLYTKYPGESYPGRVGTMSIVVRVFSLMQTTRQPVNLYAMATNKKS